MASSNDTSQHSNTLNRTSTAASFNERLDENYLFLLNFVNDAMEKLPVVSQQLAKAWIVKLGTMAEAHSNRLKIKRNMYLSRLIKCMVENHFEDPFLTPPPEGEIEFRDWDFSSPTDVPQWLERLAADERNKTHVGGKNFESYVATKMFENGRGACAYLAVSVKNEGDKSAWVHHQPNEYVKIEEMFKKEIGKYSRQ